MWWPIFAVLTLFNASTPLQQILDEEVKAGQLFPLQPKSPNDLHYVPSMRFSEAMDAETAKGFVEWVESANREGAEALVVEISSPGGSVKDGFDMVRAIETSKAPVYCVVDDEAASMALYVLESCQVRLMTRRSVLMAHEPWIGGEFQGQEQKWQNVVDRLHATTEAMLEHLAAHFKVSKAYIAAKIKGGKEWWINWQEAVKVGAVDGTTPAAEVVAAALRTAGKYPPK